MSSVPLPGARVLLTGGAGLIGSTLADQLVTRGVGEIVVLDDMSRGTSRNLATAMTSGKVHLVEGDINDRSLLRRLLPDVDVVFHLAAIRITRCAAEPRAAKRVLVDGTYEVAEACLEAGVRKLVFSSTASVYGLAEQFPTREDHHPWANDTLYGAAKVWGEGLLRALHTTHGLDYVALRYFNVFGPRMDTHGAYTEVLIRWMERIENGEPPLIFGDGAATMDFVFTTDIARANIAAAEAPVTDRVFNVASAREVSLRGLAEALLRVMGREDLGVEHLPPRTTAGGVTRRLADISAARDALGWQPEVGLDEGLRRLVAWWRAEQKELVA